MFLPFLHVKFSHDWQYQRADIKAQWCLADPRKVLCPLTAIYTRCNVYYPWHGNEAVIFLRFLVIFQTSRGNTSLRDWNPFVHAVSRLYTFWGSLGISFTSELGVWILNFIEITGIEIFCLFRSKCSFMSLILIFFPRPTCFLVFFHTAVLKTNTN